MFCQNCGAEINDKAVVCVKCGVKVPGRGTPAAAGGESAALRWILPVGRTGLSMAAGYLGLLSLIPVVGVAALITGIFAVREINRNPALHGLGRAWFGVIAGALSVVGWTSLFLIGANN